MTINTDHPPLIAGPILRRVKTDELVLWLVTSCQTEIHWQVYTDAENSKPCMHGTVASDHENMVSLGKRAYLHCLRLHLDQPLPVDRWIGYDIGLHINDDLRWLAQTAPSICYEGRQRPEFVFKSRVDQLLHGSCRKPHFDGRDGLLVVDELLSKARAEGVEQQPALLLCTGDQVYTDDVAGPLLTAIMQVIDQLGLVSESLPDDHLDAPIDSQSLRDDPHYYHRSELLPARGEHSGIKKVLFMGARKPVFTSVNAENHLLTLSEVIAQYLLVWSPVPWEHTSIEKIPANLTKKQQQHYQSQLAKIQRFREGLPRVRRVLANVPTYMIFDDHDITDDWNLSLSWERSAYEEPLARRVVGNALIGYFLCQGWGNAPENFDQKLIRDVRETMAGGNDKRHDELIGRLLKFEDWKYTIDTQPRVVVLDTRTQRWHSPTSPDWPSGLMDWESLAEAQQQLVGQRAVILVSPAPIFGVKLIEVVQRILTWCSLSLTVDAENWMAHRGSASAMLNIFNHRKTPENFIILSGDVHYSCVSDILLRGVEDSPSIWQITSSGISNEFPARLLRFFDRLNRWMFASRSPLNWLTRRRRMRIRQRRPGQYSDRYRHQRLVNGCGVGRVMLDAEGRPEKIEQVLSTGERVEFVPGYESDWVH